MKKKINTAIIACTLAIGVIFTSFFGQEKSTFFGDSLGYYLYLPSTFIYHNHKSLTEYPADKNIPPFVQRMLHSLKENLITPKGYYINQYTYGVALMESPFFLIAHGYEKMRGLPANGFSPSYNNMLKVGTLFYALLGLYILFLCLKRFFNDTSSLLAMSIIILGTNFLWFATVQAGMAHIILFFLVASLLYFTIRIYESPKLSYFILAGLSIGLIALIRPTDVILISIPFLYRVYDIRSIGDKFKFLFLHRWKVAAAMLAFLIVMLPQIWYWKELTGHFIFYSYGSNQKFHWRHPHIMDGLFSYKNGWLTYSPVMIFSIIGMLCVRQLKMFYLVLLSTLPVYIYLIYAWYCYTYINGFGSRPMVNIYPLLAFPLAAFIQFIGRQHLVFKLLTGVAIVFLSAVCFSYTIQEGKENLWSENSTKTFNLHTMFRLKLDYNDVVCFDNEIIQPDKSKLTYLSTLDSENFEHFESAQIISDSIKKSKVYYLHNGNEYPERALHFKYNTQQFAGANWFKCSGNFYAPEYCGHYKNHMIVLEIKSDTGTVYWTSCVINNKLGLANVPTPPEGFSLFDIRSKVWGEVYFFAPVSKKLKDGDEINMIIWGIGRGDLMIDDLRLELYR